MASNTIRKTMRVDCDICYSSVIHRHLIHCPFCKKGQCETCTIRYLMGIKTDQPNCMHCGKIWTLEFLTLKTQPSFYNGIYRSRRAQILFEREKSMLPITQPEVAREIERRKTKKDIKELESENAMFKAIIKENLVKIARLQNTDSKDVKKDVKFTRACPVKDCRGFLDPKFKCGTCSERICKKCNEPKGKDKKTRRSHKCDEGAVETMKLLKKDTKPCPACGEMIYKIEGCDQMYCVGCNTPFSWTTGKIDTGVVHNPHYYEIQRKLHGVAPRAVGDVRCGGIPHHNDLRKKAFFLGIDVDGPEMVHIYNAYRTYHHIREVELPRYPTTIRDNGDLRLKYLMKETDEKKWKAELKKRQKASEKNGSVNQVLVMVTDMIASIFGNIMIDNDVYKHIVSLSTLLEYTNKQLKNIGNTYKNQYPFISNEWQFFRSVEEYKRSIRKHETTIRLI